MGRKIMQYNPFHCLKRRTQHWFAASKDRNFSWLLCWSPLVGMCASCSWDKQKWLSIKGIQGKRIKKKSRKWPQLHDQTPTFFTCIMQMHIKRRQGFNHTSQLPSWTFWSYLWMLLLCFNSSMESVERSPKLAWCIFYHYDSCVRFWISAITITFSYMRLCWLWDSH